MAGDATPHPVVRPHGNRCDTARVDAAPGPELIWHDEQPLRRPILLIALRGLFDIGEAATSALDWIRDRTDASMLAEIDPEEFFDFTETRPEVRHVDGVRRIDWPVAEVLACRTEGARDLVIVSATEPQHRWRSYADRIVEIVRRSGIEMVATVGAMAAPVPHTRPFPVTGSAIDPRLADGLGLGAPTYQGPTGVVGAIHDRLDAAGVPTIALRVAVPHYVVSTPSPRATRSLLRRIEQITRVPLHYADLDGDVEDWQRRVDGAIATDDDHARYVEQLERRVDSTESLLPSGEDLADELEAFLRERETDDD